MTAAASSTARAFATGVDKGIQSLRYGAIGRHGSIAVVEDSILPMKALLSGLLLVPYCQESFQRELDAITEWYNAHRTHTWLGAAHLSVA